MTFATASASRSRGFRAIRALASSIAALTIGALLATAVSVPATAGPARPTSLYATLTTTAGAPLTAALGVETTLVALDASTMLPPALPTVPDVVGHETGAGNGIWKFDDLSQPNGVRTNQYYVLKISGAANSYTQYYPNTTLIQRAHAFWFPFSSGSPQYIAQSIDTAVTISGKVTNTAGVGLKNQEVNAYRWDGTNWTLVNGSAPSRTSSTGTYSIPNLDPGSYKLYFYDCYYFDFSCTTNSGYTDAFSGGSATLAGATAIFVGFGQTATFNQKLAAGGKISGKIAFKDRNSAAVFGADAMIPVAYSLIPNGAGFYMGVNKDSFYYGARTSSTGKWLIPGLPTGAYVVKFINDGYTYPNVDDQLSEFYVSDSAVDHYAAKLWSDAHVFTVSAGATIARSQVTRLPWIVSDPLNPAPNQLTITVHKPNAAPQSNAKVTIVSSDSEQFSFSGVTNSSGQVAIPRLPYPAHYDLQIVDNGTLAPTMQPYIEPDWLYDGSYSTRDIVLDSLTPLGFVETPTIAMTPDSLIPSNQVVGTTFTVTATPNQSNTTKIIQWLRDGVPIFGANTDTYTLQPGDLLHNVIARATLSKPGLPSFAQFGPPLYVQAGGQIHNTVAPGISPTVGNMAGVTLSASPGQWDVPGVTLHYEWQTDGDGNQSTWTPIAGETSRTYVTTPADASKNIRAVITASKYAYDYSAPVTTNMASIGLAPAPHPTVAPTFTATAITVPFVGTRFTVAPVVMNVAGINARYEWLLDGIPVNTPDTTTRSQDLTTAQSGLVQLHVFTDTVNHTIEPQGYTDYDSYIVVRKGAVGPTIQSAGVVSRQSPPAAISAPTTPVEAGVSVFISLPVGWHYPNSDNHNTVSWQWYRQFGSGVPAKIVGATANHYTARNADIGAKLTIRETTNYPALYPKPATTILDAGLVVANAALVNSVPTVTISGSGSIGSTAKAIVPPWAGVTGLTLKYQWYSCDGDGSYCLIGNFPTNYHPIGGATGAGLVLSNALHGLRVVVKVTASKKYYQPASAIAVQYVEVGSGTGFDTISPPVITGGLLSSTAHVGQKLTSASAVYDVPGVSKSYQWQVCVVVSNESECSPGSSSWVDIVGATATTYVPKGGDATAFNRIRVSENGIRLPDGNRIDFSASVPLAIGIQKLVKAPAITKTTATFKVSKGTWIPAGTPGSDCYDWFVEGSTPNSGLDCSETNTYQRSPMDGTQSIHVRVQNVSDGYANGLTWAVAQKGAAPTTSATPILNNTFGQTLSLAGSPFTLPGGALSNGEPQPTYSFQWYANGKAIVGKTASYFTPSTGYIGKAITVKVTFTSAFYASKSYTAPAVVLLGNTFTQTAVIDSSDGLTVQPGSVLTANTDSYLPSAGVAFSFQWKHQVGGSGPWTDIAGANKKSYTVTTADPLAHIRVVITSKRVGYTTLIANVGERIVDYLPAINSILPPVITGNARVGQVLTVDRGTIDVSGVTYTQQWYENGTVIPGATGLTFTPTPSQYEDEVSATVTAHKPGYVDAPFVSSPVTIGAGDAPAPLTPIAMTVSPSNVLGAIPGPGVVLSVDTYSATGTPTNTFDLPGLDYYYQWYRQPGGTGPFIALTGQTGPTYTVQAGDTTYTTYRVLITAGRNGYEGFFAQVDSEGAQ